MFKDGTTLDALQALLDRWAAGDEEVVDRLVELPMERLDRHAGYELAGYPTVRARYRASDIAQSARVRLLNALRAIEPERRPTTARAFLKLAAAMVERELIDLGRYLRSKKRRMEPRPGEDRQDSDRTDQRGIELLKDLGAGPVEEAQRSDFYRYVGEVLTEEQREVFHHHVHGMTYPEVATLMGVPEIRVRRCWDKCLERLRHALETDAGDGDDNAG